MIKNPRFLFSTLLIILFLIVCYVFGISWSAITYRDWLTSEVRGIYFYRINWQTLFSAIFLIYWAINIEIPEQTIVRLQKSSLLARVYILKTLKLAFVFAFIYWLLPWSRIFQFSPNGKDIWAFFSLWTLQVILSISWTLIIVFLVQIILNYISCPPVLAGLVVNSLIDAIVFLPFLDNSVFAQTQVTAFIAPGGLRAGVSYSVFALFLYVIVLSSLYILFRNSVRRREWIK